MKKIVLLFLINFVISCDPELLSNPSPGVIGGVGAVGGAVITKVKKDIEEISKLPPAINLRAIEVCRMSSEVKDFIECDLTPCKEKQGNCKRFIRYSSLDLDNTVFIKKEGWKRLVAQIKALCFSPEEAFRDVCKYYYEDYKEVDRLFIF